MFERITVIDNSREADGPREKHHTIELSDREHRERLEAKFVYVPPPPVEDMSPALKAKFNKARELTKDTKVIKLKEGKKNVGKKSKNSKKTATKNNPKSNPPAVAQVQEKL